MNVAPTLAVPSNCKPSVRLFLSFHGMDVDGPNESVPKSRRFVFQPSPLPKRPLVPSKAEVLDGLPLHAGDEGLPQGRPADGRDGVFCREDTLKKNAVDLRWKKNTWYEPTQSTSTH